MEHHFINYFHLSLTNHLLLSKYLHSFHNFEFSLSIFIHSSSLLCFPLWDSWPRFFIVYYLSYISSIYSEVRWGGMTINQCNILLIGSIIALYYMILNWSLSEIICFRKSRFVLRNFQEKSCVVSQWFSRKMQNLQFQRKKIELVI